MVFRQSEAKPAAPIGGLLNKITIAEAAFRERAAWINGLYVSAAIFSMLSLFPTVARPYCVLAFGISLIFVHSWRSKYRKSEPASLEWDDEQLRLVRNGEEQGSIRWSEMSLAQHSDDFSPHHPPSLLTLYDSTGDPKVVIPLTGTSWFLQKRLWATIWLKLDEMGGYPRQLDVAPRLLWSNRIAAWAWLFMLPGVALMFMTLLQFWTMSIILVGVLPSNLNSLIQHIPYRGRLLFGRKPRDLELHRVVMQSLSESLGSIPAYGVKFCIESADVLHRWIDRRRVLAWVVIVAGMVMTAAGIWNWFTGLDHTYWGLSSMVIGLVSICIAGYVLLWFRATSIVSGYTYVKKLEEEAAVTVDSPRALQGRPEKISVYLLAVDVVRSQVRILESDALQEPESVDDVPPQLQHQKLGGSNEQN